MLAALTDWASQHTGAPGREAVFVSTKLVELFDQGVASVVSGM